MTGKETNKPSDFVAAWREVSRRVDEDRAAYTWMQKVSALLLDSHRFRPSDVFSHASQSDLRGWQHALDKGLPFLTHVQDSVNARLSGKLEVLEDDTGN